VGAPHKRDRLWIAAKANANYRFAASQPQEQWSEVSYPNCR
jgi:hypothetical protein